MLEVKPNKELLKIKNKMFMGFTGTQFFSMILGIIVGTVLFILLPIPLILKPYVLLVIIGVCVIPAFFKFDGMNIIQFIGAVMSTLCGRPLVVENNIEKEMKVNGCNRDRKKRHGKG